MRKGAEAEVPQRPKRKTCWRSLRSEAASLRSKKTGVQRVCKDGTVLVAARSTPSSVLATCSDALCYVRSFLFLVVRPGATSSRKICMVFSAKKGNLLGERLVHTTLNLGSTLATSLCSSEKAEKAPFGSNFNDHTHTTPPLVTQP